jgi:hypothetical protein
MSVEPQPRPAVLRRPAITSVPAAGSVQVLPRWNAATRARSLDTSSRTRASPAAGESGQTTRSPSAEDPLRFPIRIIYMRIHTANAPVEAAVAGFTGRGSVWTGQAWWRTRRSHPWARATSGERASLSVCLSVAPL